MRYTCMLSDEVYVLCAHFLPMPVEGSTLLVSDDVRYIGHLSEFTMFDISLAGSL